MIQNSTDPFIAYCKQHNEKPQISSRKVNYLAMMSNYKSKKINRHLFEINPDEVVKVVYLIQKKIIYLMISFNKGKTCSQIHTGKTKLSTL